MTGLIVMLRMQIKHELWSWKESTHLPLYGYVSTFESRKEVHDPKKEALGLVEVETDVVLMLL